MLFRLFLYSLVTSIGLASLATKSTQAADVEAGLIGEFTDGTTTVREIVATPNFNLSDNESISPRIAPKFTATWTGVLRVIRGGAYSLSGATNIQIDGKLTRSDSPIDLSSGDHTLVIKTTRTESNSRQQLRWNSDFFADEPIPSSAFGHPVPRDGALALDQEIEHGRFLFAEHGCGNCHESGAWNLATRRGPDLSNVGARAQSHWMGQWLADPRHYRPASVMPVPHMSPEQRRDILAFLEQLTVSPIPDGGRKPSEDVLNAGQALFGQVGCTKCHDERNNLDSVGLKYQSATALAQYIGDPKLTDAHGRMPQLFDMATEAHLVRQLAEYLYHAKRKMFIPNARVEAPVEDGDPLRGAALFKSTGCADCHTTDHKGSKIVGTSKAPAFAPSSGLPLRHFWDFESQVVDQAGNNNGRVSGDEKYGPAATKPGSKSGGGKSFEFDGKNYIELGHFHRPDIMTISVWIKTEHGGEVIAWGRPGGGLRGSRELRVNIGQDGKNSVCYGEYNSDSGWRPVIARPTDINLVDNQWHHLAVVRNGSNVLHFVDGKLQGKGGSVQKGAGNYTDRLLIGALGLQGNPSNRFRGSIDDLSIWDKALSAEQIGKLASGVSPLVMGRARKTRVAAFRPAAGCLADALPNTVPDFQFSDDQRTSLQKFLATVQPDKPVYDAPRTAFDLRIRQFRCTACHELNDTNVQAAQQVDDRGRIVRVELPPRLTGVGDRLTVDWLESVLLEKRRNRPWLQLRMPHFGQSVAELPILFPKSSGATLVDESPRPDMKLATAGIATIGVQRGKVACISCHNYRGINRQKEGVVPAPDLAEAASTVRHDWFRRWLHNPTRLQPGTSMPQFFLDLSRPDRERKIDELWSALVHQNKMPLPDGLLNRQTEGTRILVNKHPVLFRMATRTPAGQVNRAINVGLPGGSNFTFDPESCSLRFAWQGAFIDAGPAWNGRGGNPVTASGQSLFQAPGISPLRFDDNDQPPEVDFLGYRLVEKHPVFRYQVDGKLVEHRIDVDGDLVTQTFEIEDPGESVRFVGESQLKSTSDVGTWNGSVLTVVDRIVVPDGKVMRFKVTSQAAK